MESMIKGLIHGFFAGLLGGEIVGLVKIGDVRLHHYLALLAPPFLEDPYWQGVFAGIGLSDLPDLLRDLGQK